MSRTRAIRIILLYAVCTAGGILAGIVASAMIVRAAAGPHCCAPGDGIGVILFAMVLVPLGAVLGFVLAATVLRVRRRPLGHDPDFRVLYGWPVYRSEQGYIRSSLHHLAMKATEADATEITLKTGKHTIFGHNEFGVATRPAKHPSDSPMPLGAQEEM
jgi:hypothetical protein